VRRGDSSPKMTQGDDDDDDDDDPWQIRLTLQTKDSKAKKCSLVIGKVSAVDSNNNNNNNNNPAFQRSLPV